MSLSILLQAAPTSTPEIVQLLIPFGLMFLVFWFLILKPQKKEQDEHKSFLGGLKAGDEVVTAGGIFGTIKHVNDKVITLEITKGTKIKILKEQIQGSQSKHTSSDNKEEKNEKNEDNKSKGKD